MADNYMEKALLKIARQLNAYDEASLMSLWETYAEKVRRFEPTKKWEEAALVFSVIHGMHMKNQLFNYHWAESRKPDQPIPEFDFAGLTAPKPGPREVDRNGNTVEPKGSGDSGDDAEVGKGKTKRGKLIELKPRK